MDMLQGDPAHRVWRISTEYMWSWAFLVAHLYRPDGCCGGSGGCARCAAHPAMSAASACRSGAPHLPAPTPFPAHLICLLQRPQPQWDRNWWSWEVCRNAGAGRGAGCPRWSQRQWDGLWINYTSLFSTSMVSWMNYIQFSSCWKLALQHHSTGAGQHSYIIEQEQGRKNGNAILLSTLVFVLKNINCLYTSVTSEESWLCAKASQRAPSWLSASAEILF